MPSILANPVYSWPGGGGIVTRPAKESTSPWFPSDRNDFIYPGKRGVRRAGTCTDQCDIPIPENMPDEDAAAFLIPFQTAYIALARRGRLLPGETLLVHGGAGGVGSAAIQVGCALGARVIATATGPERVKACLELGATVAIDIGTEEFAAAVNKATDGRGANVVFDPVGGDVFIRSFDCIANEGRLLAIGYSSGKWKNAATGAVVFKNCSVVGVLAALYDKEFLDRTHEELLTLYAEGKIRPATQKMPFEDIPIALADLADRKVIGRVVAAL